MEKLPNQKDNFPRQAVRTAIRNGLAKAEAQPANDQNDRRKPSKFKKKALYALSSVAALLGILISSSYYSPALASSLHQIPVVGSVFADPNEVGLKQAIKKGQATGIHETQTKNGVSVTIDEIGYDQNDITVKASITSEKALDQTYFGSGMDFTINGDIPDSATAGYTQKFKSPTKHTGIQEIDVSEEMPTAFDLGLIMKSKDGEKWYFSAPVKQIPVDTIPVQYKEKVHGVELSVNKVTLSETSMGVSLKAKEKERELEYASGSYIEFHVVNQNGRQIKDYSGGTTSKKTGDKIVTKSNKKFDPLDAGVKELTITPYVDPPTDGGGITWDEDGKASDLPFKGDKLKPVTFKPFKVKVPQ